MTNPKAVNASNSKAIAKFANAGVGYFGHIVTIHRVNQHFHSHTVTFTANDGMITRMQNHVLSVPNFLTLLRIVMTPVMVYLVIEGQAWLALALMIIAGLTDMLDGLIARYFNQRTIVGAYLDPIADKIMLISLIIVLFHVNQVPFFLFLAVIFRDALIVIGAITYEMVTHSLKMEPSLISKATTLAQIVYVVLLLLNMASPIDTIWLSISLWTTFVLTFASGLHYLILWTQKAAAQTD